MISIKHLCILGCLAGFGALFVSCDLTSQKEEYSPSAVASTTKVLMGTPLSKSPTTDPGSSIRCTLTPTNIHVSNATPTPMPPKPTMTNEQLINMLEILNSEECILPCYLGITPGETTWGDAKSIMDEHRFLLLSEWWPTLQDPYSYRLNFEIKGEQAYHSLVFSVINNVVQGIRISISKITNSDLLYETWSRYSLQQIMQDYGIPDFASIDIDENAPGYLLLLHYEKLGILYNYNGLKEGDTICAKYDKNHTNGLYIELINTRSSLDIFERYPGLGDENRWRSIEDVLHIKLKDFYNQILLDSSNCFPVEYWK
jgi:hypothetical protein